MVQRSMVTMVSKRSNSLRAVIPQEVAKKLKLRLADTLEWSENRSGDIVVKNIGVPVFKR